MIRFTSLGIRTELSLSFFLLLFLIAMSGNSLFAFASALFSYLHELAHASAARALGYTPEKISAGLFGGVMHLREGFIRPFHELLIHLAGPSFNLITAAALFFLNQLVLSQLLADIILANLVLGLFNLMPFYPLDGGKITKLYLSFFIGFGRAEKVSRFFSGLFSLFLFFLGIYLVQYNGMNLLVSALGINLFLAGRADRGFLFYKVAKDIRTGGPRNREKLVVCRCHTKAIKVIHSYRPMDNRIFTVVNEKGSYRGQLSEDELLAGIYDCGIYADFEKLLAQKRRKKNI